MTTCHNPGLSIEITPDFEGDGTLTLTIYRELGFVTNYDTASTEPYRQPSPIIDLVWGCRNSSEMVRTLSVYATDAKAWIDRAMAAIGERIVIVPPEEAP